MFRGGSTESPISVHRPYNDSTVEGMADVSGGRTGRLVFVEK